MKNEKVLELLPRIRWYWTTIGRTSNSKKIIEVFFAPIDSDPSKIDSTWAGPFLWMIGGSLTSDYRVSEHLDTLLSWTMTALHENFDSWKESDGREAFGDVPNENLDLEEYIRRLRESVQIRKLINSL